VRKLKKKNHLVSLRAIPEISRKENKNYSNLCGADALSKIALLDISGLLFGFSIWMGMLQQQEKGESISPRALAFSALHTPTFIGAVLGVVLGTTGLMKWFLAQPLGPVYLGCEKMFA
jgi:hypothetical protein